MQPRRRAKNLAGEPIYVYRSWREDLAEIREPRRYKGHNHVMMREAAGPQLLGYALACVKDACKPRFGES